MSIQIGRIKGISIRLHFTLLVVFSLVAWTLAMSFMPQLFPGLTSLEYWVMGIAGAILLFASVLLHELSHSIIALKFGIKVRQIILFIFGGVSDIEEETRNPRKEFEIAFAGPATSFILSAIFAALWLIMSSAAFQGAQVFEGIMLYGAIINALLGAFNLLPAFPLDGGRILRAALVGRMKRDFDRANGHRRQDRHSNILRPHGAGLFCDPHQRLSQRHLAAPHRVVSPERSAILQVPV
mgnify:CR=1 FL=1